MGNAGRADIVFPSLSLLVLTVCCISLKADTLTVDFFENSSKIRDLIDSWENFLIWDA